MLKSPKLQSWVRFLVPLLFIEKAAQRCVAFFVTNLSAIVSVRRKDDIQKV